MSGFRKRALSDSVVCCGTRRRLKLTFEIDVTDGEVVQAGGLTNIVAELALSLSDEGRLAASAGEHGAIVEAIAAGDAALAAKAMTDVIETGRRNRAAALQSHLDAAQSKE